MSFGNLRHRIDLITIKVTTDEAGFERREETVVASPRAAIEQRHASSVWVNRAAYTNATVMIRIRIIPGVSVEENMEIGTHLGRFLIDSVEVIAGKYVQILAHNKASEGKQILGL